MTLSIAAKQNYTYIGLIILVSLASIFFYRLTQQQWIIFRNAEIQFDDKEYETAIFLYKKSVDAGYPLSQVSLKLARSYAATSNFQEAAKFYKIYLLEYPKDKKVRLEYARALSYIGDFKQSESEYKKIIEK